MDFEIVEGSVDSLLEIVDVNFSIFDGMYESPPYSLEQYRSRLEGKECVIFTVMSDEVLVGDSVSYFQEDSLYLWIMGVLPDFRGKGLGSKLLESNERCARERGVSSVGVKVYGVSKGMRKLLGDRGYNLIKNVESDKSDRLSEYHYRLSLI